MHGTVSGADGTANAALLRRQALAGESGWAGLVHNRRVFALAVFASLGGLLYGYNQGVFSSVLGMHSFNVRMAEVVNDSGLKGKVIRWFVAVLELGAWVGVLASGPLADIISRKRTIVLAVIVFIIGAIIQTCAMAPDSIFAGRFIVGLGVGSLSFVVPLYNAELSPPEVRGSLVALQQLSITAGIMISFWIDYGTNFIGGTGEGQKEVAWRLPLALQIVPALILGIGTFFLPYSPRWLVNQGRDDEALAVLAKARRLPDTNDLVQIEFLEIRAEYLFEKETSEAKWPQYQAVLFRRVATGAITMFFQQWTGINAILYYAPSIFKALGLEGNALSLLATGVVGIVMFLATIPATLWIDKIGRKPILISGAFAMGACHFIVAALIGQFRDSWETHRAAGWVACVFVWLFAIAFGYSWGPAAWILISEIFPLSVRGKGMSVAASSNWMNNFIVGQVTPSMLDAMPYGTFIFFGMFSTLGGVFIWFLCPETKGLSLEEMDAAFGDTGARLAAEDRARQQAIHKRLGLDTFFDKETGHGSDTDEKKVHAEERKEHMKEATGTTGTTA
ncbi:general substrate transporter [Auriculariales sp. MPI-PUGE-AT-0066]|nr:general substrate transporter [Auriculariales sp. MPI-PUGE-AT-0066]